MEMSGICGTDKHTFQGYTTQYGGRALEFPIIQGHENVGTIAAIGGNGKYADFEGVGAARGRSRGGWRERGVRRVLLLPARFSVLLLRENDGLWEQPEREESAAPVWRMVAIHCTWCREVFW